MASSGSSSSSTMTSSSSSSSGTTSLNVSLPSFANLVSVRLDRHNYLLWLGQIVPALNCHDLFKFVDGSYPTPLQFVTSADGKTQELNPSFLSWKRHDQLVLSWINAMLTEPVLAQVIGLHTAKDVWDALTRLFSSNSEARVMQLKKQMMSLDRGSLSMIDYLGKVKGIADALASAQAPISNTDLVLNTLHGLPSEYEGFVTTMMARSEGHSQ
ncbi:hypothetical protein AQUCO_00100800v1 [Aquilegia coerulea]|uniref:Uncharacterized protein n=1 Tax=Aquilegia coerulea TaxID=218851 RepID=A0A2G5FC38_AQUCA|nr:hypothetical protein AQUCO_00100800v1 [Aquilegia coerulea]